MPVFTTHPIGAPCWVDLSSPDVDGAIAFYSAVFGWDHEDSFDPEGTRVYTNFSKDGHVVCGLGEQQPEMAGMPPIWSTYIATDDIAAVTARVEAAGGSVMLPELQVMDVGAMAIYADPTDAVFSVWKAGTHLGSGIANDPDTWSWNELLTRDLDPALDFYASVFGWTYDPQEMPGMVYNVVKLGDAEIGGAMPMPAEVPDMVPNHWAVYFAVEDAAATIAKVAAEGGTIGSGPDEIPGVGTIAILHDPQGGSFCIMQPLTA